MCAGDGVEELLRALHAAGVDAVGGRQATHRALDDLPVGGRVRLIAVGKAASAMALGARDALGGAIESALVITKHGHLDDDLTSDQRFDCRESAHPVPDASSLDAGRALIDFVSAVPDDAHLIALISGGTSALIECLPDDITLGDLTRLTDDLLASGVPIGEMNRIRREQSRIKGGRLVAHLGACRATQLLISDVPGDRPEDIGSGPLVDPRVETHIIASSALAQQAVVDAAQQRGMNVVQASGSLDGDVDDVRDHIAATLLDPAAAAGVYIWGGEPTVVLPVSPGRGGRNQHLALAIAGCIDGHDDLAVLVAATDGTDGPTNDAGGLVDGQTLVAGTALGLDAEAALRGADAGNWLDRAGALITTGPTGTNVMDLAIAVRTARR